MKVAAIALTLVAVVLVALALVPSLADQREVLLGIALSCGAFSLVKQVLDRTSRTGAAATAAPAPAQANQVSATATDAPRRAEAEVISFLATLQEKGRLVDFLMDDVTGYDDSQVGAAARVVHEGRRAALDECFTIVPVTESAEGTTISVPESHRSDEYRLTGKLSGEPPFNGTVVHRGWMSTATRLPQIIVPDGELPCIAPAEVEVKG